MWLVLCGDNPPPSAIWRGPAASAPRGLGGMTWLPPWCGIWAAVGERLPGMGWGGVVVVVVVVRPARPYRSCACPALWQPQSKRSREPRVFLDGRCTVWFSVTAQQQMGKIQGLGLGLCLQCSQTLMIPDLCFVWRGATGGQSTMLLFCKCFSPLGAG